tara:strand:- start:713 stop:1348 length:636 start_codon:yes stop_codon:yes gene_type:complete
MIATKICGITNNSDAKLAISMGASAIGFIFYKNSPRYVNIKTAKMISSKNPKGRFIGVFVNEDIDYIKRVIDEVGLDGIQLHGDESNVFCQSFNVPVIKAITIKPNLNKSVFDKYDVSALLFDTYDKNLPGGTGKTFDWSMLNLDHIKLPIILSGGLNDQNIIEGIKTVNPSALDINSGVELKPGKKSKTKMKIVFSKLISSKNKGYKFDK